MSSTRNLLQNQTHDFLTNLHITIPLNQRNFEWEEQEITVFLQDFFDSFIEDCKDYCTGMFLLLEEDSKKKHFSIWDGQQRFIVILLSLIRIINTFREQQSEDDDFFVSKFRSLYKAKCDMTKNEKRLLERWSYLPRVEYLSEEQDDNDILRDIFNKKVHVKEDIFEECDGKGDGKVFRCKSCKSIMKRKNDFVRHVATDCKCISTCDQVRYTYYKKDNNKILNAYCIISKVIGSFKLDYESARNFTEHILSGISCDIEVCKDYKSAAKRFDCLNNRGKTVSRITIAKNMFISRSRESERKRIASFFDELRNTVLIDDDRRMHVKDDDILEICLRIHYRDFAYSNNKFFELTTKGCKTTEETFALFESLWSILGNVQFIINYVKDNYHYALYELDMGTWKSLILPLGCFYKEDTTFLRDLLDVIVSHYTRVKIVTKKHPNFEFVAILNEFFRVCDSVYNSDNNANATVLKEIKKRLYNNSVMKYEADTKQKYYEKIKNIPTFCQNKSIIVNKFILSYLVHKTSTKSVKYNISEIDLEHIIPKSKFINTDERNRYCNSLGNCTLFEKSNSGSYHKGNRSVQNKDWETKKKSYETSSIIMNRQLAQSHDTFDYSVIEKRETELAFKLFDITEQFLTIKT